MVPELAEFLAGYHPVMRPTGPPEPLSGGLSGARLWVFPSVAGRLVARGWPSDMTSGRLGRIHDWLEDARALPFVAAPWKDREGRTFRVVQDRCWELMAWKPGAPDLLQGPDPGKLASAGAGLAAFHARLAARGRQGPSPGLIQRAEELARLVQGDLDRLEGAIARSFPDTLREPARAWLGSSRSTAERLLRESRAIVSRSFPLQPCLRDARPEHFLFQGNVLTGLIDFGAMEADTVALDLARLFREVPRLGHSDRAACLDAYQGVRPLEPETLRLIDRLAATGEFLTAARWLRWRYLENAAWATEEIVAKRLHWAIDQPAAARSPISGT